MPHLSRIAAFDLLVELVDEVRETLKVRDDELMAERSGNENDVVQNETKKSRRLMLVQCVKLQVTIGLRAEEVLNCKLL